MFNGLKTKYVQNKYQNGQLAMGWDGSELHNFFNGSEIEGGGEVGFPDYNKRYEITIDESGFFISSSDTPYYTLTYGGGYDGQHNYRGVTITAKENIWIRGDTPLPKGQSITIKTLNLGLGIAQRYTGGPIYVYPCE